MATRCTTHFTDGRLERPTAIVYRHWDGYPEGAGKDIYRFFEAVEAQTSDTRFSDPSYLAAKYVVFLAGNFAGNADAPLDFLSVGIVDRDPGDIEYRYLIDCGSLDENGRPTVTCYEVEGDWEPGGLPLRYVPVPIPRPEPAHAEEV